MHKLPSHWHISNLKALVGQRHAKQFLLQKEVRFSQICNDAQLYGMDSVIHAGKKAFSS